MDKSVLSLIQMFMPLIVLLIIVLIGLAAWQSFKRSSIGMLTDALACELKNGNATVTEEEIAATPRSLSGMDSLLLPKIARDFPEFSWNEWRVRIEDAVRAESEGKSADGTAKLYKTVIARYHKNEGTCSILAETNASYLPVDESGNAMPLRKQSVFETELIYVQDADKVQGKAFGVNCVNCGAPVKMLGQKSCPYCGTGLEPINLRVWTIASVRET